MISLIAAVSKNNVIGNKGLIPWHIKGEQKRFKELTTGRTIIMGRKSFEEIGKPLPNRKTVLISSTKLIEAENCITAASLKEALKAAEGEEEIFIAGGGRVYEEAMSYADRIYLTVIELVTEGDTFFPDFDKSLFTEVYKERIEGEIPYTYYTYERRRQ
jgi:dihydrofolate reductase/dihydrofolate reductase (trimethoprim resistance protein)